MWGHTGNVYPPTRHLDEKQDVIGHQPTHSPDFSGKEIGPDEEVLVGTNKLAPRRSLFSLRSRWEVVTLQDVTDRLVAHRIPYIFQRADNAIIAPRAILFGELDD